MTFTLVGLVALAFAVALRCILVSVASIGIGSSIYHPEATRMARHASAGGKAWRRGCSRSADISAERSARCWPRSSSCRAASEPGVVLGSCLLAMVLMAWTAGAHAEIRPDQAAPGVTLGPQDGVRTPLAGDDRGRADGPDRADVLQERLYGESFTSSTPST